MTTLEALYKAYCTCLNCGSISDRPLFQQLCNDCSDKMIKSISNAFAPMREAAEKMGIKRVRHFATLKYLINDYFWQEEYAVVRGLV